MGRGRFQHTLLCIALAAGGCHPMIAPEAPPAPRIERRTAAPAARRIWIPGHWRWTRGDGWSWERGYWATPRPGRVFAPGYWSRDARGWRFHPGLWRRSHE